MGGAIIRELFIFLITQSSREESELESDKLLLESLKTQAEISSSWKCMGSHA